MAIKHEKSTIERRRHGARGSSLSTGVITFIVGALIVTYLFLTNPDPKGLEAYWLINNALCLWLPLIVILMVMRQDPTDFGMQRGDSRSGARCALFAWIAMLIPVYVVSTRPEFSAQYLHHRLSTDLTGVGPVYYNGTINIKALIYYELAMGFYMFCWEFFFRGFLLFGLQKTFLKSAGAVVVQALPFMLLHWSWHAEASKPWLEVLGSLPAGLILGALAIRTQSFLWGYLAHWGVSLTLDLFLVSPFIFRHIG